MAAMDGSLSHIEHLVKGLNWWRKHEKNLCDENGTPWAGALTLVHASTQRVINLSTLSRNEANLSPYNQANVQDNVRFKVIKDTIRANEGNRHRVQCIERQDAHDRPGQAEIRTLMTYMSERPAVINRARTGNGPAPDDGGTDDENDDEALPSDPNKCTVPELRALLGNLGLNNKGLKPVLVDRVKLLRNGVAADSDDDDPDACATESAVFHQSIERQGLTGAPRVTAPVVPVVDESDESESEPEPESEPVAGVTAAFICAAEFAGAREGYCFKTDTLGLGYYVDGQVS